MTSDAKIGLLLGLVFIFVIAFIINGLPNLRPQTSKGEITRIMNPTAEESFSVAGNAQKAQADWTAVLEDQKSNSGAAQTAAGEQSQMTIAPQATGGPGSRSFLPLGSIETWLEHIATANAQQKEQQSTYVMDVPQSTAMQPPAVTEHPPAVAPARSRPAESVVPAPDILQAARSVTASDRAGWKVYVVGEGESLASVAKKMYGAEEGNRVRNIRRIYEANKDILKSADEVGTGQKLVIPPPLPPLPPKPEDVLSQELFQKVDAIGQKTTVKAPAKAPAPSPAPAPEGRWYVVQDGDNLWKIATNQLGSGTRYEEIAKLNADLLKNKDTLDVGMRIRLPVK